MAAAQANQSENGCKPFVSNEATFSRRSLTGDEQSSIADQGDLEHLIRTRGKRTAVEVSPPRRIEDDDQPEDEVRNEAAMKVRRIDQALHKQVCSTDGQEERSRNQNRQMLRTMLRRRIDDQHHEHELQAAKSRRQIIPMQDEFSGDQGTKTDGQATHRAEFADHQVFNDRNLRIQHCEEANAINNLLKAGRMQVRKEAGKFPNEILPS